MAAKQIAYDQDALQAIRRGLNVLARAVKATLGPRGRNVVIRGNSAPAGVIWPRIIRWIILP